MQPEQLSLAFCHHKLVHGGTNNDMSIKDLEPKVVWGNFYGLTQVPRPSKHEEKVIEYLLQWGKEHNVEVMKDETGNVIFRAPATPGFENRRGVILQGHMDMVPQKTSDSDHNFLTDPIKAYVDGDWVTADRTTLGADNGMGVAMGLAALEDNSVQHGPIEILVTYDEETGMTGAEALKPGLLKGDILLNIDSEDEKAEMASLRVRDLRASISRPGSNTTRSLAI